MVASGAQTVHSGEGPFLYFCWALGESAVAFCHGEEEGFEERRSVEAEASA